KLPWSERGGRVPNQEERNDVREKEVLMNKEDVLERAWKYCEERADGCPYFDYDGANEHDPWPGDFRDMQSVLAVALRNLRHIQAKHRGQYAKQDEEFKKNILNTVALEAAKELVQRIS